MKNKLFKSLLVASVLMYPLNTFAAPIKKETVFTNLDSEGKVVETVVTNHICPKSLKEFEDQTLLNEIVNINGSETFTQEGTKLTWKVEGKDIYYQGTTNEEQPIDISIKYYLNGKELKPNEIKGQKGNVKIKLHLKNKLKNRVKVKGKYETLYTPFVVLAGTIIDAENNSNISATNGRVVNTGDKNIVASIASPGLYESINLNKLSSLNEIEFSFYTTDFKMDNIYIIATPKLLDEKDTKLFKDLNKVTDSIKLLQDSMDKIQNGSNQLKNGTNDLLSGVNLISSKLPTEQDNQTNETKLTYLKGQNDTTVVSLTQANQQLSTKLATINSKIATANSKKSDAEASKNKATVLYNSKKTEINQVLALKPLLNQTDEVINAQTNGAFTTKAALEEAINNAELVKGLYEATTALDSSLDSTIQLLNETKTSLTTSIEANKNLIKLISGNNQVVESSITTISSMRTLSGAMNQLNGGIKKLNEGATTLNTGIAKFNKEGINKLSSYSNTISNYSSKAEALINLSKNYKGYASDNVSETIFVNKVQSIK